MLKAQTIRFVKDSLTLEEGSSFLNAIAIINNSSNDTANLSLSVQSPTGWSIMNYDNEVKLLPRSEETVVLVLTKQRNAIANWQSVVLQTKNEKTKHTEQASFYINTPRLSLPYIETPEPFITLGENDRYLTYHFLVKNRGNFEEKYFLSVNSNLFGIAYKGSLRITPGQDSLFTFKQRIKSDTALFNHEERIRIEVTSEAGKWVFNQIAVTIVPHTITKNASAFDQVNFSYETGLFAFNEKLSYYGSLKGSVNTNKTNLKFFYRTKQLGFANTVDNNIFGITFKRPRSQYYIGDIINSDFFYTRGLGASVIQTSRRGNEYALFYLKGQAHAFLDGDLLMASAHYKLPLKMSIEQKLAFNQQQGKQDRYVMHNELRVLKTEIFKLSIAGGIGSDEKIKSKGPIGTSLGYQADINYKSISVNSFLLTNNKYYPGFGKAKRDERHNISLKRNHFSLNAFMTQNAFLTNPFRDTIYFSDALISNIQRYGAGAAFSFKSGYLSFAYGKAHSTMESSNSLSHFRTIDFSGNIRFGKNSSFQVSSLTGYDHKKEFGILAITTNSRVSYLHKFAGFTGLYVRTPIFSKDNGKRVLTGFQEMVNFGPTLNLCIARTLQLQLNYTVQKSIADNELTSFVNGNISYAGKHNGMMFNMQFINPLSRSKAIGLGLNTSNYNLTVTKQFRLPVPGSRKRYSIKLHLFADLNLNGMQDKDEQSIEGRIIGIGNEKMQTDKNGNAAYKNTSPGNYLFDLSSAIKENYPSVGKSLEVKLEKDRMVNIPFVSNKSIKGQLKLSVDEYSNRKFSFEGVKVIAVDTLGNTYSALANEKGEFSIYVPMGSFRVSVNPTALGEELKTKSPFYTVELNEKTEPVIVIELIQKKRAIKFIN